MAQNTPKINNIVMDNFVPYYYSVYNLNFSVMLTQSPWVFEPALFLVLLIFFFFFLILDWSPDLWFELYVCLIVFFILSLPHQLQVKVIKKSGEKKG